MKHPSIPHTKASRGFMLLEVLLALLIFSLGVLGLVGLQANAVKQSGQAKYRSDATLLTNDLIGEMWVSNRTFANLSTNFTSTSPGGANYTAWAQRVASTLPGGLAPTVTLVQMNPLPMWTDAGATGASDPTLISSTQVTITIFWKSPSDPSNDAAHKLVTVTEIK